MTEVPHTDRRPVAHETPAGATPEPVQPRAYEPPRLIELGSVDELTLGPNPGANPDGVFTASTP